MSQKKHFRVYLPKIIGGLIAAIAIFFIVKVIINLMHEKPNKHDKKVQIVTLKPPPPPPPPPPKPPETPKPPEVKEKIKEPVKEPEPEVAPEPVPESKPSEDSNGNEGEGAGNGEGNGAGGPCNGPNCIGGGGGGRGSINMWYGGLVKKEMLALLSNQEELKKEKYFAIVKVWVKADGVIDRIELAQETNLKKVDDILNRVLNQLRNTKIGEPPPAKMPQPIKFKISDRV